MTKMIKTASWLVEFAVICEIIFWNVGIFCGFDDIFPTKCKNRFYVI